MNENKAKETKSICYYYGVITSEVQATCDVCQSSGQSYKQFTLINYESRVVPDWKIPHIMTLES